ncbi:MAG TPA: DUF2628 domain-containing protein [bacterium]|nr:DUF2628 domain-containing protein [bacterium]
MARLWRVIAGAFGAIRLGVRRVLEVQIGPSRKEDPMATLYHQPLPPRLSFNWWALALGPFWYLVRGLWVHASILSVLVFLSGGTLFPFVWLYAGLKANEDLLEVRIAQKSFY